MDVEPTSGGKMRLIINGHPLVEYELPRKFKMEQIWKEGRTLFSGCSYGSVIDISNAFYHIDMARESQKYIGFEWLGKFYHYNSLPIGIHSAPFIFTEVTKPMVRAWRSKGFLVLKYLDDFPSGAPSFLLQRLHCHYMVEHMRSLGWVLKEAKLLGYPDPLPELPALPVGIIVSFSAQQFRLKPAHAQEILDLAARLDSLRACPVKVLSRFAGLIVSRSHCLGPAARMRTRAIYANIEDRLKPHEKLQINTSCRIGWARSAHLRAADKAEIAFWTQNLHKVNGQPFRREDIHIVMDIDIDTDASKCGWGAVLYLPDPSAASEPILLNAARRALPPSMTLTSIKLALRQGIKICGVFSPTEAENSSNVRELLATSTLNPKPPFQAFLPLSRG